MAEAATAQPRLKRALSFRDLTLFYIVTGMMPDLKRQIEASIKAIPD